jgi:hypothetical protein
MFPDLLEGVLEEFAAVQRPGGEFLRPDAWSGYGMVIVPYHVCHACKKPCESSYCSDKCRNRSIEASKRYYQSLTSEQKAKKNEAGRAKKRQRDAKYREARRLKNGTKRIAKKGSSRADKRTEYNKRYYENNRERIRELKRASEARAKAADPEGWATKKRARVKKSQNNKKAKNAALRVDSEVAGSTPSNNRTGKAK